jgi:hypothetical protein
VTLHGDPRFEALVRDRHVVDQRFEAKPDPTQTELRTLAMAHSPAAIATPRSRCSNARRAGRPDRRPPA